jgi:hypothetical protein
MSMAAPMLIVDGSDDAFHAWPLGSADWVEALWFGAWIPELATSVYVYNWFRPGLGIFGGGCMVWDRRGHLPWEIPVYQYDVNQPLPQRLDLRNLSLPTGTRVTCLRDGWDYRVQFANAQVEVFLEFSATTPPDLTEDRGSAEFFSCHLDQPGRYRGYVQLEGRRHAIDCHGIRDRSWGPRRIGDDVRMGYCHGESAELAFLAFSQPDRPRERVYKGFLNLDGRRAALVDGERRVCAPDGCLQRIELHLRDVDGRSLDAVGTPLNYFTYLPYPNLLSRHYLMRWQCPQGTVYGEEQDLWSVALWSGRHRRRRE